MGKRNTQRKNVALLNSDNTGDVKNLSVSEVKTVELNKDRLLDQAVEALFEKRFVTLLHQCLNSIKRGSSKEIALASHSIGLLSLTIGCGDNALEILEESFTPISQVLKSPSDSLKTTSLLECLAIITFIGQYDQEGIERSMQIVWLLVHPKMGSNVIAAKLSASTISAVTSAWSFLLSIADGWRCNPKYWLEPIAYFSTLLDREDRSVRIAAGEALALIFQKIGNLDNFTVESKDSNDSLREGLTHIQGLRVKILNQMRNLAMEAGGKGSAKKDLNNQRNSFRDILELLEDGYSPETSIKIGSDILSTSTWSELIQLNYLKHFLGGGFVKHMQDNEFLQDILGFTPKKKQFSDSANQRSIDKRLYKSPNSAASKARTQQLNKQRMLSQTRNAGCMGYEDE